MFTTNNIAENSSVFLKEVVVHWYSNHTYMVETEQSF